MMVPEKKKNTLMRSFRESYTDDNLRQKFEEDIETDAIKSSEMASNDLSSENSDHENQVELDQPLIIDDGSGKICR